MENRRSTIEFTEITTPLLSKLESEGFDLRNIINGSVLAFSLLSGDDQKKAIAITNGVEDIELEIVTASNEELEKIIDEKVEARFRQYRQEFLRKDFERFARELRVRKHKKGTSRPAQGR